MNHRRIKVLQKHHEATTGQPGGGILEYLGTDLAESRQEDPTTTHHLDLVPTLDQTFGKAQCMSRGHRPVESPSYQ
jgi:hypothetical protein